MILLRIGEKGSFGEEGGDGTETLSLNSATSCASHRLHDADISMSVKTGDSISLASSLTTGARRMPASLAMRAGLSC